MTAGADRLVFAQSVTHRYGETLALDDVGIAAAKGRMTGLIGPDGVGKSTLLGLIAGVRRIQSGRVEVLGGDMGSLSYRREVCARIAYMPQGLGRNLYPSLSVFENIDFFGRLYGQSTEERRWRIDELLRGTGLDPFPDRPAGKLSGGMKQKLSLCCALIHDPTLLILDEPTTGVDPLSRQQFWDLIDHIRARSPDLGVIVSTAYIEEARRFDRLFAMNAGKVIGEGTSDELCRLTRKRTLEDAFIALLPPALREGHRKIVLPPRKQGDGIPAITARGLTKRFGDFTAVDDVTMEVAQGEIFGFLGSNGCGKTTTMKMLTGLVPPSAGEARLWGQPVDAQDMQTRERVGYMSQSFSLYSELTVEQNLLLHARLFHLEPSTLTTRIGEALDRFGLEPYRDMLPDDLPLGIRQRLQLAVAVIHKPELLILDEPTSGVDPIARDRFWELLIELSRKDGVTIFISTHFVNEAERCDRVSLMHAGKILAVGPPDSLRKKKRAKTLEEAFVDYLKQAANADGTEDAATPSAPPQIMSQLADAPSKWFDRRRLMAFARREALELVRDPIRIAFALLGPLVLMIAMAYGISFDIEDISYAVLDNDRSLESRTLVEEFSGSRYFKERPPVATPDEIERRLQSGKVNAIIVIPPGYGRDLMSGRNPEISAWLDGANAFRAETTRGYVEGVFASYMQDLSRAQSGDTARLYPATINPRFRYNQAFESIYAIAPGVLMMLLIMVPAMLTALGIVREKELGSIINLYAAPASKIEFLLGKQIPYVVVAMVSFLTLVAMILFFFQVPMQGSFAALAFGALLYTSAATGFGLVVSTFVNSQIAAIFATAIIVMIPTVNFSGMMYPVSTLQGGARVLGEFFPALHFQTISAGVFNKGLGFVDLWQSYLALAGFCLAFWLISALLLREQAA